MVTIRAASYIITLEGQNGCNSKTWKDEKDESTSFTAERKHSSEQ